MHDDNYAGGSRKIRSIGTRQFFIQKPSSVGYGAQSGKTKSIPPFLAIFSLPINPSARSSGVRASSSSNSYTLDLQLFNRQLDAWMDQRRGCNR
jgi:hypothetical protein